MTEITFLLVFILHENVTLRQIRQSKVFNLSATLAAGIAYSKIYALFDVLLKV